MTRLGSPGVSSQSVSGFFDQNQKNRLGPKNIPNGFFYKKDSTAELELQIIVFFIQQRRKNGNICPCRDQQKNYKKTTKKHNKKHHGKHKRLDWFVMTMSRQMAELTRCSCHLIFLGFSLFFLIIALSDGMPAWGGMPSNCKAL